uniref:Uncharacterized protein n=1 Tax=viral metagenome TaxID=1070528 RepID=A0A6C0CAE5_9ZZZZ
MAEQHRMLHEQIQMYPMNNLTTAREYVRIIAVLE